MAARDVVAFRLDLKTIADLKRASRRKRRRVSELVREIVTRALEEARQR